MDHLPLQRIVISANGDLWKLSGGEGDFGVYASFKEAWRAACELSARASSAGSDCEVLVR